MSSRPLQLGHRAVTQPTEREPGVLERCCPVVPTQAPPSPAGPGKVGRGVPESVPDVVVELAEADLRALLCRELRPLGAYMSGRLKVKGDLAVAMKLEAVLRALK